VSLQYIARKSIIYTCVKCLTCKIELPEKVQACHGFPEISLEKAVRRGHQNFASIRSKNPHVRLADRAAHIAGM
ncbi:MAG: hypothetical protein AB7H77_09335, partial [Bdellovibrionales bacterium]